ncbi:energy-coupled thiamine transporter ThiT [Tissierella carlieri]|uniref:Energy-coupled thiamine transporter ThiT n=1 Tax=Tissierella carlieri TaxID=689904 RepID=A0ABT1S5U5_9FIRM|nr:energy-coupled thiamine transporter ThiT [Tissierella carlieri]MCQ4921838.1 energy-coupled thiamine transporter ThiT [Tissierella carlieri]
MEKRWDVKMLTEGGMMIALATILSYIKVYEAPMGGSVTAGSMIPIILFAIRWGLIPGLAIGSTYGILQFILKPYFYHPIQFILDYPLAFGLLGLAGIAYYIKDKNSFKGYLNVFLAVFIGILGRMISHVLSGVVFFAEYAGDKNPWIYSIEYNAYYLVPELIISCIVIAIIWKPLNKAIKAK